MPKYIPRTADAELRSRLDATGAVLVEGAKACGKTETARQMAESEVLLDVDSAAREAAELNPALVLEGDTPRLIDEWQLEPAIWNHVRRAVDEVSSQGNSSSPVRRSRPTTTPGTPAQAESAV